MEYAGGAQFNPINGAAHPAMGRGASEVYQNRKSSPVANIVDVHAGRPTVRSGRFSPAGIKTYSRD